jgi:hypothetical protein
MDSPLDTVSWPRVMTMVTMTMVTMTTMTIDDYDYRMNTTKQASIPYVSPQFRAKGRCYAVPFGIQVIADFHGIAWFALVVVVVHSGFEQKCVFALGIPHSVHALLRGRHKHVGFRVRHEVPHALIDRYLGSLQRRRKSSLQLLLYVD